MDDSAGIEIRYRATGAPSTVWLSKDLTHWQVLTNVPPVTGLVSLADHHNPAQGRRFYRVEFKSAPTTKQLRVVDAQTAPGFFVEYPGQGLPTRLLTSSDLMDWSELAKFPPRSGLIVARDPEGLRHPQRFYRVQYGHGPTDSPLWVSSTPSGALLEYWTTNLAATILTSTNLVDWTVLAEPGEWSGPVLLLDLNARESPHRFYRLMLDL
jgi:hypothetical protein